MKKTKVFASMAMAAVMALSMGSMAFAAAGPDIGSGAQPGYPDSTVTLAITDQDPVNLSATVPIYIPLAMKKGTVTTAAPAMYAPTDVKIYNTSTTPVEGSDLTAQDLAIKVSEIRASIDQSGPKTWALTEAAALNGGKNTMQLTMAGGTFTELAANSQGSVSITPDAAAGLEKIAADESALIAIQAQAGGKNSEYAVADAVNLFKIRFVIESDPIVP